VIRLLNTTVHVESRSLFCNALNTSATPASPECVAMRICSMYLCDNKVNSMFKSSFKVGGAVLGFGRGGL